MTFCEIPVADSKLAVKSKVRLHDGFELNGVLTKKTDQALTLVHADPATHIHLVHEIHLASIVRVFQDVPTVHEKFNALPIGTFFSRNNMTGEFASENGRLRQKITSTHYLRWDRGSRSGTHLNDMTGSRWRNELATSMDVIPLDEGMARLKTILEGLQPRES